MYRKHMKRFLDVVIAIIMLLVLSWLFLIITIIIKLNSKGPVLFKQNRVGKNKKEFVIYKFRTMYTNTPKDMPTHMLTDPSSHITGIGKILRKTSLDELPQLINILCGDMSFVGPRPALWNQFDLVSERDKYAANDILPGLTGYAQINGRDELEISRKAELDGYYAKHLSCWLDIKILCGTCYCVVAGNGIREGVRK